MNPRQLKLNIELPNLIATLVAYRDVAKKSKWYICFYLPGPDGRYNPGTAVVSSSKVPKLVRNLKEAYQKMKILEREKYTGVFFEDVLLRGEVSDNLAVRVSSQESHFLFWSYRKVKLYFLVSSKTNTFTRSFDLDDTKTIIETLSSAENLAANLIHQLKK